MLEHYLKMKGIYCNSRLHQSGRFFFFTSTFADHTASYYNDQIYDKIIKANADSETLFDCNSGSNRLPSIYLVSVGGDKRKKKCKMQNKVLNAPLLNFRETVRASLSRWEGGDWVMNNVSGWEETVSALTVV